MTSHGGPALQDEKEGGSEESQAQRLLKHLPPASSKPGCRDRTILQDFSMECHCRKPVLFLLTSCTPWQSDKLVHDLVQMPDSNSFSKGFWAGSSQNSWGIDFSEHRKDQNSPNLMVVLSEAHLDKPPSNLLVNKQPNSFSSSHSPPPTPPPSRSEIALPSILKVQVEVLSLNQNESFLFFSEL